MKKIILCIYIVILIFTLIACGNDEKTSNNNKKEVNLEEVYSKVYTEFDTKYDINKEFSKISEYTKLNVQNKMSDSDITAKYNLSSFEGLSYAVWSNVTSDSIEEIAIIKLKDTNQSYDVMNESISRRIKNLKVDFSSNTTLTELLNSPSKTIIEQNKGVIILVISDNAKDIMQKLTESLKED